jgi:hypothetical protein
MLIHLRTIQSSDLFIASLLYNTNTRAMLERTPPNHPALSHNPSTRARAKLMLPYHLSRIHPVPIVNNTSRPKKKNAFVRCMRGPNRWPDRGKPKEERKDDAMPCFPCHAACMLNRRKGMCYTVVLCVVIEEGSLPKNAEPYLCVCV